MHEKSKKKRKLIKRSRHILESQSSLSFCVAQKQCLQTFQQILLTVYHIRLNLMLEFLLIV